ncbi:MULTISPECIES: type II CAAX endopeptidase family protein [unclassified Pseudoalteromonas]|jgi:membrane protease YdiL (CAAX protease family)|uniref:CPBP family intramembrane glutamic endopeptidase n=1 Tax=unclassified Pseudoalteromonas TaxID=194690 RepID=UPI000690E776|nr:MULTISPECIES: type II CAAX endopeptidase family protein [unclassified Pseudoalteromonas]MDN3405444.1 type II CAAX endopeptidase family protein [Pseudoalteromonas sp. APC 3218]MDN3410899.1 type II CAAX endopeptidase family protein [Pseudoalteromonas sp. APC 3894]MDN3418212.1 type II CAAX endopeptidase family protein [Pseudoalteromonas sp. APC 3227]MDN3421910.1 type II CAAX endopeptidase family protein [Pseudoalteromonas sp. APC 3895]MDN3425606.1 type II CAAX endopeptidase family protein [Pse
MMQLKLKRWFEFGLISIFVITDFIGSMYLSTNNYIIFFLILFSSTLLTFALGSVLKSISIILLVKYMMITFIPYFFVWPIHLLSPLMAFVVIAYFRGEKEYYLNLSNHKLKKGLLEGGAVLVISVSALFIWANSSASEIQYLKRMIPDLPAIQLAMAALGFALINAFLEEWMFRGVFQETLLKLKLSFSLATAIQATLFAIAHYKLGVPSGNIGLAMTFMYACALTLLVRKTGSLLVPILIHIFTDIAVFYLIVNS